MSFTVLLISLINICLYVSDTQSLGIPDPLCPIITTISSQTVIPSTLISTANNKSNGYIIFKLQAESDVIVYLSPSQTCTLETCFKIVIDKNNTGTTAIKTKSALGATSPISSVPNVTLNNSVNETFWISWDSGNNDYIRFGYSDTIDNNTQLISTLFSKSDMKKEVNSVLFVSRNGDAILYIYNQCSDSPTETPTKTPTETPTQTTSQIPTNIPSKLPTIYPSVVPTAIPTMIPTNDPSATSTITPTKNPTNFPTDFPTDFPTAFPTDFPTYFQTTYPSMAPIQMEPDIVSQKQSHINISANMMLLIYVGGGLLIFTILILVICIACIVCKQSKKSSKNGSSKKNTESPMETMAKDMIIMGSSSNRSASNISDENINNNTVNNKTDIIQEIGNEGDNLMLEHISIDKIIFNENVNTTLGEIESELNDDMSFDINYQISNDRIIATELQNNQSDIHNVTEGRIPLESLVTIE